MGNKTNHAEPMAPKEVLRRAEAFDPLPVEPVGCPCPACSATKQMKREHAIMRLALQMIVRQTTFPDSFAAQIARRTAEQALRECGK